MRCQVDAQSRDHLDLHVYLRLQEQCIIEEDLIK